MTWAKLAEKLCSENRGRTSEASKRREPTMSLRPEKIGGVPEETARVAKACFPKGNRYIRLREALGTIFEDNEFADLFPRSGQAADAVRARMDIKYLLGLELTDPGFDFSVLSEFRTRLVEHQAEHRLFEL